MATDGQIRDWARENGMTVSTKGRVSQGVRDAYSAAHNGHEPPPADYPDGMTDADFDTATAEPPDDDVVDGMAEASPRRPAPKVSSPLTGRRLADRWKRGRSKGKQKRRTGPRISTADLWGSGWRIAAKVAQPLPPIYRTLRLQSEIAGPLLDEQVKNTFVDPVLQVLARHYAAGEVIGALVGPNLGIGAAIYHQAQCAKQGVEPSPVILQACMEVTRYGFTAMMHLGGDAMAARLAAEREEEEKYGATVDMLMAWIMSPPDAPAAEDETFAKMAHMFAGQPEPAAP